MSQQEILHRNDDYSKSPSATLKRRTYTNNSIMNNSLSPDHLTPSPRIVYSHSTNGLSNLNIVRQNTEDSLDILPYNRQTKPIFDIVTDSQYDNNGSIPDDYDKKSRISNFSNDDQQSISSPDKKRKQYLSSKLLKPFHNMRLRKKSNT